MDNLVIHSVLVVKASPVSMVILGYSNFPWYGTRSEQDKQYVDSPGEVFEGDLH